MVAKSYDGPTQQAECDDCGEEEELPAEEVIGPRPKRHCESCGQQRRFTFVEDAE